MQNENSNKNNFILCGKKMKIPSPYSPFYKAIIQGVFVAIL